MLLKLHVFLRELEIGSFIWQCFWSIQSTHKVNVFLCPSGEAGKPTLWCIVSTELNPWIAVLHPDPFAASGITSLTSWTLQCGNSSSWIGSILIRTLMFYVLNFHCNVAFPGVHTGTSTSVGFKSLISSSSLWHSPWLVSLSIHNEHICLLMRKPLILCNVTMLYDGG